MCWPCVRPSGGEIGPGEYTLDFPIFWEWVAVLLLPGLIYLLKQLTQDNNFSLPFGERGWMECFKMFWGFFFSFFQVLKLCNKFMAIFLNREKLHLNYPLFNLRSVTASNDLGKVTITKLL